MIEALSKPGSQPDKVNINTKTMGSDIYVGDILKMKNSERAPCDVLILATSEELNGLQACRVDTMYDDGKAIRQVKQAVSLTKSFSNLASEDRKSRKFLERLNARVEYKQKNGEISGTFKLKADPRVETITESMIIHKGAIIKSNYVVALVLYNGRDCLGSSSSHTVFLSKRSAIESKIFVFSLTIIVLNLVACILLTLGHNRIKVYTDATMTTNINKAGFIAFVSLFFSVMPMTLNMLLRVFHIFSAFKLQHKFRDYSAGLEFKQITKFSPISMDDKGTPRSLRTSNQVPQSVVDSFNVLNPSVIDDLGDIDDAFFDKTGTLTAAKARYEVKTISTCSKLYQTNECSFKLPQDQMTHFNLKNMSNEVQINTPVNKSLKPSDPTPAQGLFRTRQSKDTLVDGIKGDISKLSYYTNEQEFPDESPEKRPLTLPGFAPIPSMNSRQIDSDLALVKGAILELVPTISERKQSFKKLNLQNSTYTVYDNDSFYSDLFNSIELQDLVTLFSICHKSKVTSN